jgi:tetratricopeptide (TPR) repeat protein
MDVASLYLMKPAVAVALLLLLSFITASAQQTPSTTPQAAGQNPAADSTQQAPDKDTVQSGPAQAPTPPDYSQQAYVVQHFSESIRFENDGTGSDQTDATIKIVSESGVQALGQLKVGYSALSDKLEIAYVRVHKPDGTTVQAQESAVQDLTFPDAPVYTDYHEKHISVPTLRPGDVIEYRFIRTIVNPLTPGQFWTSFSFTEKGIVLEEQLSINVPKDRQIILKSKPGYTPVTTEEGDRRIYRWTHSRLKDDEDSKKKKPKKDEAPTVQLTTFKDWQEVGTWYSNLERERRIPDSAVKAEANKLVKGKTDDMAKVKALYDYVSRNIRYVSLSFGLGRIQPHAASEVLSNGYGDCKDKNTLLAALLDAEGFKSTSVLIGSQRKLDPDVPSPMQFDHVITRVPVDGKEIWLDSTPGIAPFRMLSKNLRGKQALAVSPDGKAELVWTPTDMPFDAFDRTSLTGSVSDTGKITAHVNIVSRGDNEVFLRFAMRRMPSNRWKDIFDFMLQRTGLKGAEITNLKASDPSDTDSPIKVDFDVTDYNYFDWSAPESKFALPLSTVAIPGTDSDDDDDTAANEPIKFGAIQEIEAQLKLTFPAKYKLRAPIAVDVKRDYAEYHSLYSYEGSDFTSKRALKLLVREIPQSRADDYAAFRRVVKSDEAQQIALENTQPGTSAAGGSESAGDLNGAALQAINNQRFDLAVDLLQRVVKLDPKYKSVWDNLGRAYLGLGKDDEAEQAFKKQIEINPYDEFAYNGLGLVYQHQAKYDDSIKEFQKQIEINPLDQNAHANLGLLYLSQKRYIDAIPELQKAIDIHPKNPLLQVSVGQAYIATNQTEKGMAAFDKAITLAPVPMTWNNIAYSLAQQNVQLDRAIRYSDSALNATETQLHDVSLDSLRMADLATSSFLFNAWDTRGWIEFKRGNLDVAEAYVLPAFLAGGRGDQSEHLGEIYEKRGKRDDAIRYYVFSLISDSPSTQGRSRLEAMGVKDVDSRMAAARADLQSLRTVPLHQSDKGTAEFFLLMAPGKVEQVTFIKGDDNLKGFTETLQKADVIMKFPPQTQAQAVRRAIVHCGTTAPAACTLELLPSSDVRSLN